MDDSEQYANQQYDDETDTTSESKGSGAGTTIVIMLVLIVALATGLGAQYLHSQSADIPPAYKTELIKLRDRNVELQKKCQDLQRQQNEMQAEMQWTQQRMELVAGQAMGAAGYDAKDYRVNLDRMKIEKH